MGFDIDLDISMDRGDIEEAVADEAENLAREWIETEAGDGQIKCDCGTRSFDIETWKNASGEIRAAGICRECNERTEFDVDMSDLDGLR